MRQGARTKYRTCQRGPGRLWLATLLLSLAGGARAQVAAHENYRVPPEYFAQCCALQSTGFLADPTLDTEASAFTLNFDNEAKDSAGLKRDTLYFAGYQFAAVAILYAMPESVTGWSVQDKQDYSMSKYWHNVTHPRIDTDEFYLNYIIHPYWGASYFVRARERGYSNGQSFWYSFMLSAMFEFGAEALAEPVSYQDLVMTPGLGSLLGMWFMDVRQGVRDRTVERGYRSFGDKVIFVLTDPLGSINHQVDRLFRIDADISIYPYYASKPTIEDPFARPYAMRGETAVGLNLVVNW